MSVWGNSFAPASANAVVASQATAVPSVSVTGAVQPGAPMTAMSVSAAVQPGMSTAGSSISTVPMSATVSVVPLTSGAQASVTIPTVNAVPVMSNSVGGGGPTTLPRQPIAPATVTVNAIPVNNTVSAGISAAPTAVSASSLTGSPALSLPNAIATTAQPGTPFSTDASQVSSPSTSQTLTPSRPIQQRATPAPTVGADPTKVLDKARLAELVKEVDPLEQLDDDVEELLMNVADDFIDSVVTASAQLAKHRKASSLETKDVLLHLERNWNMWIPGFGSTDDRPYRRAPQTEAHKQRMALIKKTLKKY